MLELGRQMKMDDLVLRTLGLCPRARRVTQCAAK